MNAGNLQKLESYQYLEVLLPLAFDRSWTYKTQDPLINIGDIVQVEFKRKTIWGLVIEKNYNFSQEIANQNSPKIIDQPQIDDQKIKMILAVHQWLKFQPDLINFIQQLSNYNLASKGLVLRSLINILNSDKYQKQISFFDQKIDVNKFCLKTLTANQQLVANKIIEQLNTANTHVLDGITGSGKTEIYFHVIAEALKKQEDNKNLVENFSSAKTIDKDNIGNSSQILILLPEIALTSQLLIRFEQQFGFKVALWHSKISKKLKREIYYGIASGTTKVLIGARSALLLPFKNLKLIIIDEEHDQSFKQEDIFNFHARDMAIIKSKIKNFPVILSTATPALETYHNCIQGKFKHYHLTERFGSENKIEIIDLKQHKTKDNLIISNKLELAIIDNFNKQQQSLLFLNRRGYAPIALCKSCGKKYQCLNCDFNLVYHKNFNKLCCHHCGHQQDFPKSCSECHSSNSIINLGFGVEKLAEEVKTLIPQARILMVTSDSVKNFVDANKIVEQITSNQVDIIIGTQMIAKGYDFEKLNLVGIVDGDSMLFSADLRAMERCYQTLTQVIGRAGRRQEVGKVFIQTFNPQNFLFKNLQQDKKIFYQHELSNRKLLNLPPFSRMARLEVSSANETQAKNFAKEITKLFPSSQEIEVLGPASSPIQKLRNRHHFLLHVKAEKKINLQKLIANVLKLIKIPNSVRVRINIDP